jgi:hypothetical protein
MMDPGFYTSAQMPNEVYQKEEAVSKSDLTLFHRSPRRYKVKVIKDTAATVFGSFFHPFVLQPELIEQDYVQAYEGFNGQKDRDFLDGRAYLNGTSFKPATRQGGEIVISWKDWQTAEGMKKSLQNHSTAWNLLSSEGPREISGFWVDKRTGLECRLRADLIALATEIVGDLKTTTDARLEPFMSQISKFHYHWQGAHYLNGISEITDVKHTNFVLIAVEKDPPYDLIVYRLDNSAIYCGQEELKILMEEFAICKERDNWPGYLPDEIQPISLPGYYLKRANL